MHLLADMLQKIATVNKQLVINDLFTAAIIYYYTSLI